jgi:hypothetical protein
MPMNDSPQVQRLMVAFVFSLMNVAVAVPQERAPNGAIYRELLPFVGLKGVQLEFHGGGGNVWNLRPRPTGDLDTQFTGLSRIDRKQLVDAIQVDATETLREATIPLIEVGSSNEKPPRLVLTVSTYRFRPDAISADVTIELMQAARLVSDPSMVIWSSTWAAKASNLVTDSAALTAFLRGAARGHLQDFVRLYGRAHGKAG